MSISKKYSWKNAVVNMYVFGVFILIFVVFSLLSPRFLTSFSIINLLRTGAPLVMVSSIITLLMISGFIDFSVGSTMGLSAVLFTLMMRAGFGYGFSLVLIFLLGIVVGAINGLLVTKLKIISIIATLGTMSIFVGFARLLVPRDSDIITGGLPANFSYLGRSNWFGLPVSFFIMIVIVGLFILIQKRTILGKYSRAIGGNKLAAELSGINVVGTVWLMYILTGAVAAFSGVIRASNMGVGDPRVGTGMELDAIVAVLIGGTSFFGGEGSVARTVVGAFILITLTSGMYMVGIPPFWHYLVRGGVLILALTLDKLVKEKMAD